MPSIGSNDYTKPASTGAGWGWSAGSTPTGYGSNNNQGPYGGNNTANPYSKPNSYGPSQGAGWYNPNSGQSQYQGGMAPTGAAWNGPTPGHQGQTLSYNPQTGEQAYVNSSEGLRIGSTNTGPGGVGTLTFKDPVTGMTTINQSVLKKFLGSMGIGGGAGGGMTASQSAGGSFTPTTINQPKEYGGYDYKQQAVDPSDVIAKSQYAIDEKMNQDFADAGNRAGKSGWAMSTGYTGNLGNSARMASQDTGKLIAGYQYDAAKLASEQFNQQQLQAAANDFGAWGKSGDWDVQGQMFTGNQGLQEFLANMQNSQFNAGQQNQVGIANQNSANQSAAQQQAFLAQLLGGMGLF